MKRIVAALALVAVTIFAALVAVQWLTLRGLR